MNRIVAIFIGLCLGTALCVSATDVHLGSLSSLTWGEPKPILSVVASGNYYSTNYTENGTNFTAIVWTNGIGTCTVREPVNCDLLVVAGGGSGGDVGPGGGGGAGELYYKTGTSFVAGVYGVVVGRFGQNSRFSNLVCVSGGKGGNGGVGSNGGSGGGGSDASAGGLTTTIIGVGANGGSGGTTDSAGGGGGAGGVGSTTEDYRGGAGGVGLLISIDGSNRWYAAGGGGGGGSYGGGAGGSPGAGDGGASIGRDWGTSALPNTGSGGGGAYAAPGGEGGSGVVIVRFPRIANRTTRVATWP